MELLLYFRTLLAGFCLISMATAGIMGDECDWSGSGLTQSGDFRGITPVYLRCTAGKITWHYPKGALRVVLRHQNVNRNFKACLKINNYPKEFEQDLNFDKVHSLTSDIRRKHFPARLFLEGFSKLAPIYTSDDDNMKIIRCFRSKNGQAAIYVEAEDLNMFPYEKQAAVFEYDIQKLPKENAAENVSEYDTRTAVRSPAARMSALNKYGEDLNWEECRPCSDSELIRAYCSSDLVARGVILGVQNREELGTTQITVRVTKLIRDNDFTDRTDGNNFDLIQIMNLDKDEGNVKKNLYQTESTYKKTLNLKKNLQKDVDKLLYNLKNDQHIWKKINKSDFNRIKNINSAFKEIIAIEMFKDFHTNNDKGRKMDQKLARHLKKLENICKKINKIVNLDEATKESISLIIRGIEGLHHVWSFANTFEAAISANRKSIHAPAHCGVSAGAGEFLFMADRRLGHTHLVCAPRLEDWSMVAAKRGDSDDGSDDIIHCLLDR